MIGETETNDCLAAVNAAIAAGGLILEIYESPASDFQIEMKSDNSPLTKADKVANELICRRLAPTGLPLLSEEGKHLDYAVRRSWKKLWIVDPLDGTKEFIKKNDEFTVNIALVEDGTPVFGVIYVPVLNELYWGGKDMGAWKAQGIGADMRFLSFAELSERCSRLPLSVKRTTFTVVASRSHLNAETATYIKELEEAHGGVEVVSKGSSLKICLVAEGSADVYPRFAPTMEWDIAAGHAIAKAAGREVLRMDGQGEIPLSYNKKDLLNPWFVVK